MRTRERVLLGAAGILLYLLLAGSCASVGSGTAEPDRFSDLIDARNDNLVQQEIPPVLINEISLWNHSMYEALDGEFPRWLELRNTTDTPQQIEGWQILMHTAAGKTLRFSAFPELELSPEEIRVIAFVPNRSALPVGGVIRFGAELPDDTVSVELVDAAGATVDEFELEAVEPYDWFVPAERDFSQYRDPLLLQEIRTGCYPTPGLENDVTIPAPEFLEDSGFFDTFSLQFNTSNLPEGYEVRYTINDGISWDGDIYYGERQWFYPTLVSGERYTEPVALAETAVVKARVFSPTGACGPMVTKTFFIGEDTELPVISLSIDPADLWDETEGIYAVGPDPENENFRKNGLRMTKFEYFPDDAATQPVIDENYVFRIYGLSSRGFAQKSLALYAKEPGTTERIPNEFYKTGSAKDVGSFYSIVLRNAGGDASRGAFRDALATDITTGYGIEKQDYSPTVTFINGQYWGIYNIREKINEYFIADHSGVDPQNIDLIEGSYRGVMEVKEGSFEAIDELFDLIRNVDPKYDVTYAMYEDVIDIGNYIDYMIFQIFVNNTDWPWSNTKYWRPRTEDGKWRFIMFDTDASLDTVEEHTHRFPEEGYPHGRSDFDTLSYVFSEDNNALDSLLLKRLMRNREFYDRFFARFTELLDTHLTTSNLKSKLAAHIALVEDEMPRRAARWYFHDDITDESSSWKLEKWYDAIDIVNEFYDERPDHLRQHIIDFQASYQPPELGRIENGDFEDEDTSMWNLRWSEEKAESEILDHEGSKVGYLKVTEGGGKTWDIVGYAYDGILIDEDETLKLSFSTKVAKKPSDSETILVVLIDKATRETLVSKELKPGTEWKTHTMTFTNPGALTFSGRLQFRMGTLTTGQEAYLDNISLKTVEKKQ